VPRKRVEKQTQTAFLLFSDRINAKSAKAWQSRGSMLMQQNSRSGLHALTNRAKASTSFLGAWDGRGGASRKKKKEGSPSRIDSKRGQSWMYVYGRGGGDGRCEANGGALVERTKEMGTRRTQGGGREGGGTRAVNRRRRGKDMSVA